MVTSLVFGNRLGLVFIPPLWDFNTVMLARLPMDICSCLIVPLSMVSLCKFGTARYDVIYCFLVLVAYPAQWTGAVLHNPCKIRLGREALVLGCHYQSFCLSFQSRTSEPLVGLKSSTSASFILLGYLPCSSLSSHCFTSISWACCFTWSVLLS